MKHSKYREHVHQLFHWMAGHNEWVDSRQIAEYMQISYEMARSIIDQRIARRNIFTRMTRRQKGVKHTFYRLAASVDECIELYEANIEKDPIPIDPEHEQWMQQYRQRFVDRYLHVNGHLPTFI